MYKNFLKIGKRAVLLILTCAILLPTIASGVDKDTVGAASSDFSVEGLMVEVNNATAHTVGPNSVYAKGENTSLRNEKTYTISFTNTTDYDATIWFDYDYGALSYKVSDNSYYGDETASSTTIGTTSADNMSVFIASKETYTITCTVSTGFKLNLGFLGSFGVGKRQELTLSNIRMVLETFTVSANVSNDAYGSALVSANGNNGTSLKVPPEATVSFTATPSLTYTPKQRFAYWEVVSGATLTEEQKIQNPLTLTITQATTLKAHFEDAPADIALGVTIHNAVGGSVSVGNLATLVSSGTVAVEAESGELNLTAHPKDGYAFAGWVAGTLTDLSAALTDTNINTSLTLTLDIGIDNQYWTAIFLKQNTYTATVRDGDHGTATVGGSSSANGLLLDDMLFVATPDDGYIFDGWYDGDTLVSSSARYTHTVVEDGDVSLEARFRNPRVYVSLGTGIIGITATDSNGNTYSYSDFAFEVPTGTVLTMTVTYDDANYGGVYGWYNNATASIVSGTSGVLAYTVTVSAKDQNYTVFAKDKSGNMIGCCQNLQTGVIFGSLQDAMSAAASGQTVTLIQPVVLEKDLTIPAGVTLLVPYSSTDTGAEEVAAGAIGKAYANSLTVNEGVAITVNGTLMVNAKQGNSATVYQGNICGAYGLLTLNGNILVNGTLKARGVIQGAGRIQTSSGSTVYQMVEITDWRGGSITLDIYGSMFPLNQFYVQNIQVETEYVYGSTLKAYYFVYAASTETTGTTTLLESGNSGLYRINYGGKVVMRYEKTRNDATVAKSIVDVYGNVEVLAFSLKIKAYSIISATVSTENTICPFSAAFDVNVMDGGHLKITQRFRFLPGVNLTVHEGGTLEITSGGAMYFYDVDDYEMDSTSGYCSGQYRRLPMSIGKSSQYYAETEDAVLVVNGTLIVNGGLYSSAGAGSASSSIRTNADTGIIIMNNVNTSGSSAQEYDPDYDNGSGGSTAAIHVKNVPFVSALGHLATSADGVWEAFGVAIYFSNGSAWYTHKTEFEQNGEVLEDLTVYGVGAYGNVDAIVNGDTSSSCEFGNGYTCTHWAKESETAGTTTAPYKPYVIVYARNVSLNSTGFTLDYRLNDYIWMNAVVTIPANGTVELVDNYGGTIQLVPGTNGTYYIVRKVLSTDLTTDFVVQFKIGDVTTQTYAVGFPAFAALDNGEHEALVDAMLTYGRAADSYFQNVPWQGSALTPPKDENGNVLWDAYTKGAATHGASAGLEGISVRTSGVSAYFDNRIGFTVWFALKNGNGDRSSVLLDTLNNMYGANSIVQIGVLVGDENYSGELTTEKGKYTNAYLLYKSTKVVEGTDQNFPVNPEDDKLLDGTEHSTLTYDQIKEAMAKTYNETTKKESGCGLSFDIPTSDYMSVYKLRLFVVLDKTPADSTDAEYEVLYGSQNKYGLPTYLNATYQNGTDKYKNFVCAAWDYITKAEAAFPETKQ